MSFLPTILETLIQIIAGLASAKNPAYAPVIAAASQGVTAELTSIAAGNAPTAHSVEANVVAPAVAIAADKAISNSGNATTQSTIAAVANTAISALTVNP